MKSCPCVIALTVVLAYLGDVHAGLLTRPCNLEALNRQLHGLIVDHSHNHGADRRIRSQALGQKRDLYVYLPPGFDPAQSYPVLLYLHGYTQDERHLLEVLVPVLDQAMASGCLPPTIVACPDGDSLGPPPFFHSATFFANSRLGCYEDYVMQDVWPFLVVNYPIRPEREAHVIAGNSMGGSAAYRLGMTHADTFKVIVGIFPAVNLRWVDCHGRWLGPFDPECWGWREKVKPNEMIGRYHGGLPTIRFKHIFRRPFGCGPESLERIARINPIELLDACDVKPCQFDIYLGYGDHDEFNIGAQVESFAWRARERGLAATIDRLPGGKHDVATEAILLRRAAHWLAPLLAPYAPIPASR